MAPAAEYCFHIASRALLVSVKQLELLFAKMLLSDQFRRLDDFVKSYKELIGIFTADKAVFLLSTTSNQDVETKPFKYRI